MSMALMRKSLLRSHFRAGGFLHRGDVPQSAPARNVGPEFIHRVLRQNDILFLPLVTPESWRAYIPDECTV